MILYLASVSVVEKHLKSYFSNILYTACNKHFVYHLKIEISFMLGYLKLSRPFP